MNAYTNTWKGRSPNNLCEQFSGGLQYFNCKSAFFKYKEREKKKFTFDFKSIESRFEAVNLTNVI